MKKNKKSSDEMIFAIADALIYYIRMRQCTCTHSVEFDLNPERLALEVLCERCRLLVSLSGISTN